MISRYYAANFCAKITVPAGRVIQIRIDNDRDARYYNGAHRGMLMTAKRSPTLDAF